MGIIRGREGRGREGGGVGRGSKNTGGSRGAEDPLHKHEYKRRYYVGYLTRGYRGGIHCPQIS
jgi:hypothetical protein